MLYLQSFDLRGGNAIPYQKLDYARLVAWLGAILETDPRSSYPLFSAARIYAENPDPAKSRIALEFVYDEFLKSPNSRWPWLAHARGLGAFGWAGQRRAGTTPLWREWTPPPGG